MKKSKKITRTKKVPLRIYVECDGENLISGVPVLCKGYFQDARAILSQGGKDYKLIEDVSHFGEDKHDVYIFHGWEYNFDDLGRIQVGEALFEVSKNEPELESRKKGRKKSKPIDETKYVAVNMFRFFPNKGVSLESLFQQVDIFEDSPRRIY